jgi:DNA modification methylase
VRQSLSGVLEQVPRRHTEGIRERVYVRKTDVALAPLYRADIGPMESGPGSQLLLGDAYLQADSPQPSAESSAPVVSPMDGSLGQATSTLGVGHTIRLQTLSNVLLNPGDIDGEIAVKRSDPIYNAHAYLTKVPVTAIEPFIEAFTKPGDVVLDMYGGSGMTGVAAAMHGRRAEVRDISALGRHIGSNYVNLVDAEALRAEAGRVIADAVSRVGDVYATACAACGKTSVLSRTVWSYVYECRECQRPVNYYESFKCADWKKADMKCPSCREPFLTRGSVRVGEEPVLDTISCPCSRNLRDQDHTALINSPSLDELSVPDIAIGEDRQMFQASALKKHGLLTTASFFSPRNLAVLAALRERIGEVGDQALHDKLLFAFTAVLARASKRYQWHPKRPLNAANQNYYIAPVFYEWNVYDLFKRKLEAVIRSDDHIRVRMRQLGVSEFGEVTYLSGSADCLDLPDGSVDYVFTDPPFGSNIFYSDMNLFQEAWLDDFTNHENEAVVDRSGNGSKRRTIERYERLITDSLREAHRVLKPTGWLSLVFSNSSGEMWALVQRAIQAGGFRLEVVTILDKGQRSVKGLASGFENTVTVDLILSMRKLGPDDATELIDPPHRALAAAISDLLASDASPTPSHVYIGVIREYLRHGWKVSGLDIKEIGVALQQTGYDVDAQSGRLTRARPRPDHARPRPDLSTRATRQSRLSQAKKTPTSKSRRGDSNPGPLHYE